MSRQGRYRRRRARRRNLKALRWWYQYGRFHPLRFDARGELTPECEREILDIFSRSLKRWHPDGITTESYERFMREMERELQGGAT